jgi:hypothetical protein
MQIPRVSTRICRKTLHWLAENSTSSSRGHGASAWADEASSSSVRARIVLMGH